MASERITPLRELEEGVLQGDICVWLVRLFWENDMGFKYVIDSVNAIVYDAEVSCVIFSNWFILCSYLIKCLSYLEIYVYDGHKSYFHV